MIDNRYFETTRLELRSVGGPSAAPRVAQLMATEQCQRILFDGRQAQVFADSGEIPKTHRRLLRMPFDCFYLELSQPLMLLETEAARTLLRALVVSRVGPDGRQIAKGDSVFVFPMAREVIMDTVQQSLFAGYRYEVVSGAVHTQSPIATSTNYNGHIEPTDVGMDPQRICRLLDWILTYMMSKSIRVVRAPMSRAERRLYTRKRMPEPWHVVRVEPRIQDGGDFPEDGVEGRQHGYRYDVIGHIRFGRHKRADGTYSHTTEWVRPHQRGLQHDLYIPKTSAFLGERNPAPEMREYWER